MVRFIIGLTAVCFFCGPAEPLGAAVHGVRSPGILVAKKDKEKEEKALKEKEERLEAREKELKDWETKLEKKEEDLKKWEDSLKKKDGPIRRRSRPGTTAGPQTPPDSTPGFGPKTSVPASGKPGSSGPSPGLPTAAPTSPAKP